MSLTWVSSTLRNRQHLLQVSTVLLLTLEAIVPSYSSSVGTRMIQVPQVGITQKLVVEHIGGNRRVIVLLRELLDPSVSVLLIEIEEHERLNRVLKRISPDTRNSPDRLSEVVFVEGTSSFERIVAHNAL